MQPMFSMESDDDTKPAATAEPRNSYLEEKAFKSRTLLIFGTISDSVAADVTRRLIALDADSPDKPRVRDLWKDREAESELETAAPMTRALDPNAAVFCLSVGLESGSGSNRCTSQPWVR